MFQAAAAAGYAARTHGFANSRVRPRIRGFQTIAAEKPVVASRSGRFAEKFHRVASRPVYRRNRERTACRDRKIRAAIKFAVILNVIARDGRATGAIASSMRGIARHSHADQQRYRRLIETRAITSRFKVLDVRIYEYLLLTRLA